MTESVPAPVNRTKIALTFLLLAFYYALLATQERLHTYWGLGEIIAPFLLLLVAQIILFRMARICRTSRHNAWAVIIFTLVATMQFSVLLESLTVGIALLAWFSILAAGIAIIFKLPKVRDILIPSILLYISIFTVLNGFDVVYKTARQTYPESQQTKTALWKDVPSKNNAPDIYFIVQDAYASGDTLQRLFGLDNSGFIKYLRDKGFYVAEQSKSHYSQTMLSIASTMNMNYIQDDIVLPNNDFRDRGPAAMNFLRPRLVDFLLAQGYDMQMTSTGYDLDMATIPQKQDIRAADFRLSALDELIDRTPFYPALDVVFGRGRDFFNPHRHHYQRISAQYRFLTEQAQQSSDKPRFIYAHILLPHPPFVFDAQGEFKKTGSHDLFSYRDGRGDIRNHLYQSGWHKHYRQGYAAQVQAANHRLEEFIEAAFAEKSTRPKVIIIQGDHGSRMDEDFFSLKNSDPQEIFGILSAVYFSDGDYRGFTQTTGPLNTMRLMMNHYFATDLPLVEDHSWYSTWKKPYQFIEVSH